MTAILYDDIAPHFIALAETKITGPANILRVVRNAPWFVRFLGRKFWFGDESHSDIFYIQRS
jgi:hypothetical protein